MTGQSGRPASELDYLARPPLPAGTRIASYEVIEELGRGSFALTYLGKDLRLQRGVTIKEYLPNELARRVTNGTVQPRPESEHDGISFEWGLERFRREATTLARFRHPNIARVIAIEEANNTVYMVMEYELGQNLETLLLDGFYTDEASVRELLGPLLSALEHVHGKDFIHRDIKPENIIIRADGTPVLIDFGAARSVLRRPGERHTAMLTLGYAPYEQYGQNAHLLEGPYTDIYALAATLYRVVTGRPPVDPPSRYVRMEHAGTDPFEPAAARRRQGFSPLFLEAIDAGLRLDSAERPQTIAEWRRLLMDAPERGGTGVQRAPPDAADDDVTRRNPALRPTGVAAPTLPPPAAASPAAAPAGTPAGLQPTPARAPALRRAAAAAAAIALAAGAWSLSTVQDEAAVATVAGTTADTAAADVATQRPAATAPTAAARAEELLDAAAIAIGEQRLVHPREGSALALVREALRLAPGNRRARALLVDIEDSLLAAAEAVIDGDPARARRFVDAAEAVRGGSENVTALRRRLAAPAPATTASPVLAQLRALASGETLDPAAVSATLDLHARTRSLATRRDTAEIEVAMAALQRRLVDEARARLAVAEHASAGRLLALARRSGSPPAALEDIDRQLSLTSVDEASRLRDLLREVTADVAAGRLQSPAGDSAYDRLQAMAKLAPGHPAVGTARDRIVQAWVAEARHALASGHAPEARSALQRVERLAPGSAAASTLRTAIGAATQ